MADRRHKREKVAEDRRDGQRRRGERRQQHRRSDDRRNRERRYRDRRTRSSTSNADLLSNEEKALFRKLLFEEDEDQ